MPCGRTRDPHPDVACASGQIQAVALSPGTAIGSSTARPGCVATHAVDPHPTLAAPQPPADPDAPHKCGGKEKSTVAVDFSLPPHPISPLCTHPPSLPARISRNGVQADRYRLDLTPFSPPPRRSPYHRSHGIAAACDSGATRPTLRALRREWASYAAVTAMNRSYGEAAAVVGATAGWAGFLGVRATRCRSRRTGARQAWLPCVRSEPRSPRAKR